MTGIEVYLVGMAIGIGIKFVADLGVRLSKRSENHVDDLIANAFKSAVGGLGFNIFKNKGN